MEIRKLELNLGQKIANPFKTTRKSSTNPFKYNDFDSTVFEGNTIDPLVCADVLVSLKGKQNKLKMIASSVMGSMTKLKNSITEPIVNFVNRVKGDLSTAWNNTIHNHEGLKNITDKLNATGSKISDILNYDIGKGISDIGKSISEKLPDINLTGLGKDLSTKWNDLIGKVHQDKIPSGLSVAEYKDLWIKENELIANSIKEAA